jgi:hypothetical protein
MGAIILELPYKETGIEELSKYLLVSKLIITYNNADYSFSSTICP